MNTQYFIDKDKKYIGGFYNTTNPDGFEEVPFPPDNADQIWNGTLWVYIEGDTNV